MKRQTGLSLLFLASLCFGQDLSKPVDYTTAAKPTRLVLLDLSKQTGIQLRVDAPMEDEPLILRLKSVPLQEAMDKMAEVFAADWVDHHGYWQLERSDQKVAALKQRVLDERTRAFKDSIDALVKLEETNPPLDAVHANAIAQQFSGRKVDTGGYTATLEDFLTDSQLPGMRFCVKVLGNMDPKELAAIPPNTRVVFSSSPNSMQRALPPIDPADVQNFMEQRKIVHDAFQKVKIDPTASSLFGDIDSALVTTKPMRLICSTRNLGSQLLLQFTMVDDKGAQILYDNEILGVTWKERFEGRAQRNKIRQQKDGYPLSKEVLELAARDNMQGNAFTPITAELQDKLLNPVEHDPLSYATSDILLNGASQSNSNLIGLPDDSVEDNARYAVSSGGGKTSLVKFRSYLNASESTLDIGDQWIVLKPLDPVTAAEETANRNSLRDYFNSCVQDGYCSIEASAKFAAENSRNMTSNWPVFGAQCLLNTQSVTLFIQPCDTMRLFGSLTDTQQSTVASKSLTLRLNELGEDQRSMIYDFVFNSANNYIVDTGNTKYKWGDMVNEPTEVLPSGLPVDTQVTFTNKEQDVVFAQEEVANGRSFPVMQEESQLPYMLLSLKKPQLFKNFGGSLHPTGFRHGKERTIEVKVSMSGGRYYMADALSEEHPSNEPLMDADAFLASFPFDVRQKIEDEMAKLEARISQSSSQSATGDVPPR